MIKIEQDSCSHIDGHIRMVRGHREAERALSASPWPLTILIWPSGWEHESYSIVKSPAWIDGELIHFSHAKEKLEPKV